MNKSVYISLLALSLAACGGGSSSSPALPPPPPPPNLNPVITSPTILTVDDNATGPIYTIEASDPDGTVVSYSMLAEPDANFFSLNTTTGELSIPTAIPSTPSSDANMDGVYTLHLFATDNDNAFIGIELNVTIVDSALDASLPPSGNFELIDWKLDLPINSSGGFTGTSISIPENTLANGYTSEFFFTGPDGGMVMRSPSQGATTSSGTQYTRVELREMLRRGNTSISTRGSGGAPNLNNWAFSTAPQSALDTAGGVDGTLRVTLAVNEVTTTGESFEIGRLIIGQIHAKDDEPIRLYYRKLPGNENGTIYAAHEIAGGDDVYYNIIGSRDNDESNPANGFALNEKFTYVIDARGNTLDVDILQNDVLVGETTIDMTASGYNVADDFMYFKAGVYHVNNDADAGEAAQITIYELENSHDGYAF